MSEVDEGATWTEKRGQLTAESESESCPTCGAHLMGVALPNERAILAAERARLEGKVKALCGVDLRPPLAKDGYLLAVKDVLALLAEAD